MENYNNAQMYRPLVRDGVINTIVGSPNVYADAAEAVLEAMHFAHIYNDDMYNGEITWHDVETMESTREQLRILTGTLERPGADPFYIAIEKIRNRRKHTVVSKSKASDDFRHEHYEDAVAFSSIISSEE
ncbi:hypothetical protein ACFFGV_06595 [Pontibacillus salicampi]|uniref:Uncharacterized protein n=1 Tax=Pontibacillus salicampi TaxID=1449801 RepID=A0ABV6LLP9_9BACI